MHNPKIAFILVGGKGKRLEKICYDRPKPMADFGNKPFLEHLLVWLKTQNVTVVYLLIHHMGSHIKDYFKTGKSIGIDIEYIMEDKPLGTGGSVCNALKILGSIKSPFLLLNGDSYINVKLDSFISHIKGPAGGIVLTRRENIRQYGLVTVDNRGIVKAFNEKQESKTTGLINAGIYYFYPAWFKDIPVKKMSLEKEIIPHFLERNITIYGYISSGPFYDIGTPERYYKFLNFIKKQSYSL